MDHLIPTGTGPNGPTSGPAGTGPSEVSCLHIQAPPHVTRPLARYNVALMAEISSSETSEPSLICSAQSVILAWTSAGTLSENLPR